MVDLGPLVGRGSHLAAKGQPLAAAEVIALVADVHPLPRSQICMTDAHDVAFGIELGQNVGGLEVADHYKPLQVPSSLRRRRQHLAQSLRPLDQSLEDVQEFRRRLLVARRDEQQLHRVPLLRGNVHALRQLVMYALRKIFGVIIFPLDRIAPCATYRNNPRRFRPRPCCQPVDLRYVPPCVVAPHTPERAGGVGDSFDDEGAHLPSHDYRKLERSAVEARPCGLDPLEVERLPGPERQANPLVRGAPLGLLLVLEQRVATHAADVSSSAILPVRHVLGNPLEELRAAIFNMGTPGMGQPQRAAASWASNSTTTATAPASAYLLAAQHGE
mmetsp:Transcript_3430/g.8063  ORF Transcript_3430/g.8063 Transcript_3430/m.8063 type:complete len:330 (+) Transcript_3430:1809-2798(+)